MTDWFAATAAHTERERLALDPAENEPPEEDDPMTYPDPTAPLADGEADSLAITAHNRQRDAVALAVTVAIQSGALLHALADRARDLADDLAEAAASFDTFVADASTADQARP